MTTIVLLPSIVLAQADTGATPRDTASAPKRLEYGLGLGFVQGPDYLGSKQVRDFVSPFPYAIYRGRIVQADRGGVRGQLFKRDRVALTLSMSATISPDADRNRLREELDLPKLGSALEFGPALNVNLWENTRETQSLNLMLPVRAVLAIGGDETGAQGFIAQPHLFYRVKRGDWQYAWRGGANFGSRDYHAYYYDLPAKAARAGFATYRADAGFGGFNHTASVSRQMGKLRGAFFVRQDYLNDAVFADSPLVETTRATRVGLAFMWTLN